MSVVLMAATACTSSAPRRSSTSASPSCAWSSSADDVAGVVYGDRNGENVVIAFSSSGSQVGNCPGRSGSVAVATPFLDANGRPVLPATEPLYTPPVVAGEDIEWVPDNDIDATSVPSPSVRGGVRRVSDGSRVSLSFSDWGVVSTIGSRLLLEHDPYSGNTFGIPRVSISPDDWCVLPSVSAPLAQCSRIAEADGEGTATIAADGTAHWIPLEGASSTVDAVQGRLATDGSSVVAGFLPDAAGSSSQVAAATVDGRALILPSAPGVGLATVTRWAVAQFDGSTVSFVVRQAPQGAVTFEPSLSANAAVSADGHTLIALVDDSITHECHVETFHDDGTPTDDQTIDDPIPGCGRLVRWDDSPRTTG